MKIDFCIDSLIGGGAQRVMVTLANGLVGDHKIKLITFNKGDDFHFSKNLERVRLHRGWFRNHTLRSILQLLNHYKKRSNRPDVLISFMPANNLIAIIVAKLLGIKVIVSEHTNHLVENDTKSQLTKKYIYRFADKLTVLTSYDLPFYKKHHCNVTIMPNPLNLPQKIAPLTKREKNILLVGSLSRYQPKGFDRLLHIAAPLLKENPNWKIVIAGSGKKGRLDLEHLCSELGLKEQVLFTGFCKNISGLMQNSQVFVLPSKYEGLPMGLMEALSNGMACIAYDCVSGPSELINDGVNGLLIENQNEKLMQEGLKKLLNDDQLRYNLAKEAPESMIMYSLSKILIKWNKLFEEVIKG